MKQGGKINLHETDDVNEYKNLGSKYQRKDWTKRISSYTKKSMTNKGIIRRCMVRGEMANQTRPTRH